MSFIVVSLYSMQDSHRMFLDGAQLVVDYECERVLPGWIPRRLGEDFSLCVCVYVCGNRWWPGGEEGVGTAQIWWEGTAIQKTNVSPLLASWFSVCGDLWVFHLQNPWEQAPGWVGPRQSWAGQ